MIHNHTDMLHLLINYAFVLTATYMFHVNFTRKFTQDIGLVKKFFCYD